MRRSGSYGILRDIPSEAHSKGIKAGSLLLHSPLMAKIVASGDVNKVIKLWNVNTPDANAQHSRDIQTASDAVTFSLLMERRSRVASYDGTIRFWNAKTGQEMSTFATGYVKSVKAVAFFRKMEQHSQSAKRFNGTVKTWSLTTGLELTTFTAGQSNVACCSRAFTRCHALCQSRQATVELRSIHSSFGKPWWRSGRS